METFVILNDYPYELTLKENDFKKVRNLCVKYDLHERYIPVFEGSFYRKNYRQIGVIDLLNMIVLSKTCSSEECGIPSDYIDVDVVDTYTYVIGNPSEES